MVLEATIICLDNSEWMRNGDYFPSRMEAQIDAVNVVMGWKFQSNPENTVGILKMAKGPEVLVTPGPDIGKVLSALHAMKVQGKIDLMTSIQVAQLSLKHRQNKNQHQRMILFIGSPTQTDTAALTKLGQALKKNNVAVDVISFGEVEENHEQLEAFVKAVNSNDNSHLVVVDPGTRTLTEAVRASPLSGRAPAAGGGGEGGAAAGGGEGGEDFFGIDPNEDPELAMAIRASLEEEKRRREREEGGGGGTTQEAVMTDAPSTGGGGGGGGAVDEDEEAMLAEAIALSMQAAAGGGSGSETPSSTTSSSSATTSTPAPAASEKPAAISGGEAQQGEITDPQFLTDILKSLPGVDPNDPQIQQILESMKGQQPPQDEKKEGEK